MPFRIRLTIAVLLWAGALFSVLLIGFDLFTIVTADNIGTSWIHMDSLASLCASLLMCLIELILTVTTDERSRVGTIVCSCVVVSLFALLLLANAVGPWLIFLSVMSLLWNLLLLQQATFGDCKRKS